MRRPSGTSASQATSRTRSRTRKRRRRLRGLKMSGTETRSSSRAVDADAKESGALGNLARYEARLERSLFRNLDELRQRQDRRRNRSSPPILDAVTLDAGDAE